MILFANWTAASIVSLVASAMFVVLVAWLIFAYNHLVRRTNLVREGWSGIDVQLRRRHNLIPNLVETVKGYQQFERSLLDEITRLRTQTYEDRSVKDRQHDENALSGALKSLFAVAEGYPELKANASFLDLQSQLAEIEDHLQKARRYYNGTVRDLNIQVESFPSNLVAGVFNFMPADFFEIESAVERQLPKVELS